MKKPFSRYYELKSSGASAVDVYQAALADGLNEVSGFRMLRKVFSLSFVEAKCTVIAAEDKGSLEEHQERLAPGLERALQENEDK